MGFDVNVANGYSEDEIERTGGTFELKYPIIQWAYGNNMLASKNVPGVDSVGGWFISEQNIPAAKRDEIASALVKAGWKAENMTTTGGDVSGFHAEEITISHVASRKRWYGKTDDDQAIYGDYTSIKEKLGKAKSQFQILVVLKGLESVSPFVITVKVSAAMAIEGTTQQPGVLSIFHNTIISRADTLVRAAMGIKDNRKRMIPYREFWLSMGVNRTAKGVQFIQVGEGKESKYISVPVAYDLPASFEATTKEHLDKFAINAQERGVITEIYDSIAKGWVEEWANPTQATTPAQAQEVRKQEAFASASANGL